MKSLPRSLLLLGRWSKFDAVVDPKDRNRSLSCKLETLNLGHGWLYHSVCQVVAYLTVDQVKAGVFEGLLLLVVGVTVATLSCAVVDAQLGDQLGGVLGGVQR